MALDIDRTDLALIQEEDNFAAGTVKRRPVVREDGLLESVVASPHVIRSNHLRRREDRTDLGVERVKGSGSKRLRLGELELFRRALFGFNQDKDGDVPG